MLQPDPEPEPEPMSVSEPEAEPSDPASEPPLPPPTSPLSALPDDSPDRITHPATVERPALASQTLRTCFKGTAAEPSPSQMAVRSAIRLSQQALWEPMPEATG